MHAATGLLRNDQLARLSDGSRQVGHHVILAMHWTIDSLLNPPHLGKCQQNCSECTGTAAPLPGGLGALAACLLSCVPHQALGQGHSAPPALHIPMGVSIIVSGGVSPSPSTEPAHRGITSGGTFLTVMPMLSPAQCPHSACSLKGETPPTHFVQNRLGVQACGK